MQHRGKNNPLSESTLKTTPLNALHRKMGARMVDFGGWDMPLHYGSQIDEHHKVRRDCGIFDVSHMLAIDVRGKRARDLLAHTLANDVERLQQPGKALYSCMLNPAGGVLDDLIVYFFNETNFRLVVNAGTADKDYAWLTAQRDKVASDVEVTATATAVNDSSQISELGGMVEGLNDAVNQFLWMIALFFRLKAAGALFAANKDFQRLKITPEMLNSYNNLLISGGITAETLWWYMGRGEMLPPNFDPVKERAGIEAALLSIPPKEQVVDPELADAELPQRGVERPAGVV